jgi:hypothetical protein
MPGERTARRGMRAREGKLFQRDKKQKIQLAIR